MAGQIYNQQSINREYLKVRWKEPYVSDALNRKFFGVFVKGVYSGFVIAPDPGNGRNILVTNGSVSGGLGTGFQGSYVSGLYDETVGYSIAIQQSNQGHSKTISIPPGVNSTYVLDATGREGQRVYIILDSTYAIGQESSVRVALVNAEYVDQDPSVLVLGHVDVPNSPAAITLSDIGYDDPVYPRLTPLSNPQKAGFMPKEVWAKLDQFFAWEDLIKPDLDPNSNFVIKLKPSQRKTSSKKLYTYIDTKIPSRFPRSASGGYNGGANDDQLTSLDILTGSIGGAHQIPGNTTFSVASVSGTPSSYQMGLISVNSSDNIIVSYGSVYASLSGVSLTENLPSVSGNEMPICCFIVATDGAGVIQPMSASSLFDMRTFLNFVHSAQAYEETIASSGQTTFSASGISWNISNTIFDIEVYVNGVKQEQSTTGALDKDFRKNSSTQLEFSYTVPANAKVHIRKEGNGFAGGGSGMNLSAINTDVLPDFSGFRSLGNENRGWKRVVIKDTTNANLYEIVVTGGVLQVNSI